jgi:protein TonB
MKYLISSLFCASIGLGEAAAQQTIPPLKKEFLDSTWHVLPSAAGAHYRRETEWRDSTAGEVRDYYLSGQLRSREEFDNIRTRSYHGTSEYFDKAGLLTMHAEFAHGQRSGELRLYYPGGQLKRRERYAADQRGTGECFAPNGTPVPFFEFEIMPRYSEGDGGFQSIITAISRNFRYPKDARRRGIEGRVLVKFTVNAAGQVENVLVTQPLFPSIDAEAIKSVYSLKSFTPGQQDGKAVSVSFTTPITLRLQ